MSLILEGPLTRHTLILLKFKLSLKSQGSCMTRVRELEQALGLGGLGVG